MLSRLRESLALILLALLPFHALGITVLTRMIAGPMQPPLGAVALWKEALLGVILVLALIELVRPRGRRSETGSMRRFDRLDVCVILLMLSLFIASLLASGLSVSRFFSPSLLYGVRYDLVPLLAFVILRRVPWSDVFVRRAPIVLVGAATVTVIYALLTLVVPDAFFRVLGYSDLHSLYVPGGPIAAFQQIGDTAIRRLQGPMSGPNQFGIWLAMLLPFALALPRRWRRVITVLMLAAIVLSFSRAAWIAAAVVLGVALWPVVRRLSATTVTLGCIGVLVVALSVLYAFPSVLLRVESSADHVRNPLQAVSIILHEPLGRGLGTAGPAQNRVSDACVFLEEGSDASWAVPHQNLCVFVGDMQVQPVGRACACPLLPENWCLQLGVEGGWLALLTFLLLTLWTLGALRRSRHPLGAHTFLALLAVSIAALFLHAYEDAAVAYTVWMVVAVTLASARRPREAASPSHAADVR